MTTEPQNQRPLTSHDDSLLIEEGAAFMQLAGFDAGHARGPNNDSEAPQRTTTPLPKRHQVIVIGGGQAGLSVGYHLARQGLDFVILDADARTGDTWRRRWDSLRLFTPRSLSGLDGMRFPGRANTFPTKDEMADYLEAYAAAFALPVRHGTRVDRLCQRDGRYLVCAGVERFEADQVIVAIGNYQKPRLPSYARELDPGITQLHALQYRNPSQLRPGPVLIVGAGNSGAEIAAELARHHEVWLAGRDTGAVPFRVTSWLGRTLLCRLLLRIVFHRLLTVSTPLGRKARPDILAKGGPLIRTLRPQLKAAGVVQVPRVRGAQQGRPVLEDGRTLSVSNVLWCTGFDPGFSWIDLPVLDEHGDPVHESGVVPAAEGLYFVGLHFLHAMSSGMIHGVGRDAARIAKQVATRCER